MVIQLFVVTYCYILICKLEQDVSSQVNYFTCAIIYNYRLLVRSIRVFVDLIKVILTEDVVWGRYHFYQVDKTRIDRNLKAIIVLLLNLTISKRKSLKTAKSAQNVKNLNVMTSIFCKTLRRCAISHVNSFESRALSQYVFLAPPKSQCHYLSDIMWPCLIQS